MDLPNLKEKPTDEDRFKLLVCVFTILTIMCTVTYITMLIDKKYQILNKYPPLFIISIILIFVLVYLIVYKTYENQYLSYFLLLIFSIINGLLYSSYAWDLENDNPGLIKKTLFQAIGLFILMFLSSLILYYYKVDIKPLTYLVLVGLPIFLIFSTIFFISYISTINSKNLSKKEKELKKMTDIYNYIIILFFSGYIVVDTYILLGKDEIPVDCATGSLMYYLDILNLVSSLLDINSK